MKFESNLRRAQGLGSAKSGLHHWIGQRITAIALIPLGVWFVGAFIVLFPASFEIAYTWFSSPWNVTLAIFFIVVLFYHGYLGLQTILEDYISHELIRGSLILTTKLLSGLLALLAIVSIIKIFLN